METRIATQTGMETRIATVAVYKAVCSATQQFKHAIDREA